MHIFLSLSLFLLINMILAIIQLEDEEASNQLKIQGEYPPRGEIQEMREHPRASPHVYLDLFISFYHEPMNLELNY